MEKKKYDYSVVLSFSGKEREYVARVSEELNRLKVSHFYDFDKQEDLWGKDLARYLDKIYYESAEYLVLFISKTYAETVWPNLELSAALDRNMNDLRPNYQRYILPVYFDDTRIPGIPSTIGFYNANKITPEALATAIYKKLHPTDAVCQGVASSEKSINLLGDPAETFDGVRHDQIETLNSCHLSRLRKIYSGVGLPHIVVVYGERGLGKRSCISNFLSEIKDKPIYHIRPFYENRYKYDGIIQSLNLDTVAWQSQNDLDFESEIKRRVLSICTKKPSIVYVEHFHEFDEDSRKFLFDLASTLIARYTKAEICFIIEFDSDPASSLVEPFYELTASQTDLIQFQRLSAEDMEDCFYSYCGSIKISKDNREYILRSSLGNIMYLNIIINYLQGTGYIRAEDGQIVCSSLPDGALSDVLRKYILQRYERLDEVLKELLSKSSIVGSVFDADLLEMPFQIIGAAEKLENIERISNLIEHYTDKTYIFETNDVHNLIQNTISPEQQKEWHGILAHYFQRVLNRERRRKHTLAVEKEISLLYPIAKHFNYAAEYQTALPYYLQLITQYLKLCDYTKALETIKEIRFILDRIEVDEAESDKIEMDVSIAEGDCYRGLGQYAKAYESYDEALAYIDDAAYSQELIDINYNKAYCLYMTGKVIEAQQTLLSVCEQFNLQEENKKNYIRILSLLASICDSTNDPVTQKNYYINALTYYKENHCAAEYYELLRMASMVFDEEMALKMEKEAEKYSRSNHSIRMLAETLHNLATTELYLLKAEEISQHLDECIALFDTFGSKAVHYPLNTKGIVQAVIGQDYDAAVSTFASALTLSTESYSEIVFGTNQIQCLIQLGRFDEAYKQIQLVDSLIEMEPNEIVPVYRTFHMINWAAYHFYLNEYEQCEEYLERLNRQPDIEVRHRFLVKSLQLKLKRAQGKKARNTAGTAPYPLYRDLGERGLFFATLRFFE